MKQKKWTYLVVGLGETGLSCVRYFEKKAQAFAAIDSRKKPPGLEVMQSQFPHVDVYTGKFDANILLQAECLVISPGIPLYEPVIAQALAQGCRLSSDIELFLNEISKPCVAVTGSNGKSTLVSLLGEVAKQAGLNVPVIGNVGVAVLDMLNDKAKESDQYDAYILELSSFQLERLQNAQFDCACILNVSEDHLDRYDGFADYSNAKQIIYHFAKAAVFNRDDTETYVKDSSLNITSKSFGIDVPNAGENDYGVAAIDGVDYLMQAERKILAQHKVKIKGQHNIANALAALAIAACMHWDEQYVVQALQRFSGLDHRCQFVKTVNGVDYINDSKATNVGASLAAIEGLCGRSNKRVVLIAGGDAKGADLSPLVPAMQKYGRAAVLLGVDKESLYEMLQAVLPCKKVDFMQDAVASASALAQESDYVLLSPACASLDMFDNYMHRGQVFTQAVHAQEVHNV